MKRFVALLFMFGSALCQTNPLLRSKFPDYTKHECTRKCIPNTQPKYCEYNFLIEWMLSMEPNCIGCANGTASDCDNAECNPMDGGNRLILTYNRQVPGPPINVCQGDIISVYLRNRLLDTTSSIHWHGIHQIGTQNMDGVPHITQFPLFPYDEFHYEFLANPIGTHWYHSHSAVQRTSGAFGPLIVRVPDNINPFAHLYDTNCERVIMITDWFRDIPMSVFNDNIRNRQFRPDQVRALIVNNRGPTANNTIPPEVFTIPRGRKCRFRIIHSGSTVCPLKMKIENHEITVISSDGHDIEPIEGNSLILTNGERFDFILNANKPPDTYLITFTGGIICENSSTYALLQYDGARLKKFSYTQAMSKPINDGLKINCVNVPTNTPNCITLPQFRSIAPTDPRLRGTPNFQYYVEMDIINYAKFMERGIGESGLLTPFLNRITMEYSTSKPMLIYGEPTPSCNRENRNEFCPDTTPICECSHVVSLPYCALIEIIVYDKGTQFDVVHPMHLHGYSFAVVAAGKLGNSTTLEAVRSVDIRRNLNFPPLKDTVPVSDGGFIVLRFISYNPGFWLFHCHVDFHMEEGMQMVLKTISNLHQEGCPVF